jgi:60 kDa SS-A/Ro ribonucleoprotein
MNRFSNTTTTTRERRVAMYIPIEALQRLTAKSDALVEDAGRVRSARLHPISVLAAMRAYEADNDTSGAGTTTAVAQVTDALDVAFYAAFGNVEATGKRTLVALDVSESMSDGDVAGVPGLTPLEAETVMALATAATEPWCEVVGFHAGPGGESFARGHRWPGGIRSLTPLAFSADQRLGDAIETVSGLEFGGTDPALPMLYATRRELEVDTFVIYTDSDLRVGDVHPADALASYRRRSGIDARLVVVAMISNEFTLTDLGDVGMLGIDGFDATTPELIADFANGLA